MKKFISLLFIFTATTLMAQSSKHIEKSLWKLNALTPGATYEFGVGNDLTINFDLNVVFAGGSRGPDDFNFGFFPGLDSEFRYFTNMKRRLSKEKNIEGNSGNYVAFSTGLQFGEPFIGNYELGYDTALHIGVVYGIQRTYKKGFYWNLSFGPGVFFTHEKFNGPFGTIKANDTELGIVGVGKIGWVLGRRK